MNLYFSGIFLACRTQKEVWLEHIELGQQFSTEFVGLSKNLTTNLKIFFGKEKTKQPWFLHVRKHDIEVRRPGFHLLLCTMYQLG